MGPRSLTAVICLAEILGMLGFATFPALLPGFIDEWSLSNTDAGWINGIYYAGYLLAVPVLVSLTDRVSPRPIYLLCMGLSVFSSLGFAYFADGFWAALLLRMAAGVGLAGTYMPGLKMLSDHLGELGHGRSIAFYTASFGIGSSLSFLLAGEVVGTWGWEGAFAAAAIGPVLATIIVLVWVPRNDARTHAAPDTHLLDFRPVLQCRPVIAYVLAYTVHNFELFAFRSWIVAYFVFSQSLQDAADFWSATILAAAINMLGLPASVIGNELTSRFGRRRVISVVMVVSAVVGVLLGFSAAWPFWLVVVLAGIYGITVIADSSAITAGVVAAAPVGYRGATLAVHSCIGFSGSFIGPLAFGVMLDMTGGGNAVASWGTAFALSAAVVILGPVFLWRLLPSSPSRHGDGPPGGPP